MARGLLMRAGLVRATHGPPLGLAAVKFWTRKKLKGTRGRRDRVDPSRIPIEQKESVRWVENLARVNAPRRAPGAAASEAGRGTFASSGPPSVRCGHQPLPGGRPGRVNPVVAAAAGRCRLPVTAATGLQGRSRRPVLPAVVTPRRPGGRHPRALLRGPRRRPDLAPPPEEPLRRGVAPALADVAHAAHGPFRGRHPLVVPAGVPARRRPGASPGPGDGEPMPSPGYRPPPGTAARPRSGGIRCRRPHAPPRAGRRPDPPATSARPGCRRPLARRPGIGFNHS